MRVSLAYCRCALQLSSNICLQCSLRCHNSCFSQPAFSQVENHRGPGAIQLVVPTLCRAVVLLEHNPDRTQTDPKTSTTCQPTLRSIP